jgi:hypothetical protein
MKVTSFKAILTLGIVSLMPAIAQAGTSGGHYSVELNKTEVVYLPANAGAVVIGNPEIADVSVHSANTIFVVGRGYGETNLVVLDASGQKIMDADIQVVNNLPAHGVRIYNGAERSTYSCAPYCQPSPVLGDSPEFIGSNQGQTTTIDNNVASGNAASSFSGGGIPSFGSSRGPSSATTFSGGPSGQLNETLQSPR